MSLCDKCVSGVRHEGTPEGKFETIGGIETYVATPTGDYSKNKVLVYVTDVFGPRLPNAQLLADDFARNGYLTVVPDLFDGDSIPADALETPGKFDLPSWLGKHGPSATRPVLDKVIAALKAEGVTEFSATGYCYGGRYVAHLAADKVIKVGIVAHPSLLEIPGDLEKYKQSGIPLLINSCEFDQMFPHESQLKADEILGGGSTSTATYQRNYFAGCTHGFSVRGDLSKPEVKAGKEGAFKATVEFLKKHF